jgi:hypothetical protein
MALVQATVQQYLGAIVSGDEVAASGDGAGCPAEFYLHNVLFIKPHGGIVLLSCSFTIQGVSSLKFHSPQFFGTQEKCCLG